MAVKTDGTVAAWGWNGSGQCDVPTGLGSVAGIASGPTADTSAAIRMDGTLAVWGNTTDGQGSIPAGLTNVKAAAAGYRHMLALRDDGVVQAWGWNLFGQCTVPSGIGPVLQVAAGYNHSVALGLNGKVYSWGSNNNGQTLQLAGLLRAGAVTATGNCSMALTDLHPLITPASGSPIGGTRVTIVGQGGYMFTPPISVTIGGQPATSVRQENGNIISCVTPPGDAGEARVLIQTGSGNFEAQAFQYANACAADLDGDGAVTNGDVALVLLQFGPCTP